jgi:hypothetical protein
MVVESATVRERPLLVSFSRHPAFFVSIILSPILDESNNRYGNLATSGFLCWHYPLPDPR